MNIENPIHITLPEAEIGVQSPVGSLPTRTAVGIEVVPSQHAPFDDFLREAFLASGHEYRDTL